MADDRLQNKERLRKRVISRGDRVPAGMSAQEGSTGSRIFVIFVLLVIAVAVLFVIRHNTYTAEGYTEVWEKEISGSSVTFRGFAKFGNGLIMYSRDGAEYIDRKGNSVWQKSFQMNDPCCDVNDGYAVVYDKGGTKLCIFSTEQSTGDAQTAMALSKAVVSAKGVVYMIESDRDASYINACRKDGTTIDLSVKSVVNGDGYPFDIAVSPSGEQLLTSYISVGSSEVKESLVFRNFGSVGQDTDAKRVVGGFMDEFEGHIVTDVTFATDEYSHAFYDGGVAFFSTKVLNSPELITNIEIEETMLGVADCAEHTAVITEQSDDTADETRQLLIFDNNGRQTGSAEFTLNYTGLAVGDKNVVIYDQNEIYVYSFSGRKVASVTYDGRISSVICTNRLREFIVSESGRIVRIKAS